MALFLQQQLLIAGNTLREVGRSLVNGIEWNDRYRVDSAKCCTHCLGLRAEQIHIAVIHSHVVSGGRCIDTHLASAIALGLILLHYLGPKQAGGTELRYFHEIVFGDAHIKLYLACCQSGVYACFNQLGEIFMSPCEGISQLLYDICSGIVERSSVNGNAAEMRIILEHVDQL